LLEKVDKYYYVRVILDFDIWHDTAVMARFRWAQEKFC